MSLLTAVGMLIVFKHTSDQRRLEAVKRAIHAALFEIRLFNDDLGAIFRAQIEILRHNLTYLRLSLIPMLWMIVPLALVIAQLQFYYGYEALKPGEPVLIKAETIPNGGEVLAELDAPKGVRIETPPVWLPSESEIAWRVVPEAAGEFELRIRVGNTTYTKTLQSGAGIVRRSPLRVKSGLLDQLLYPSEAPLPASAPVGPIAVRFQEGRIEIFGWNIHWMIVYFALSLVFAFLLRKPFKVTI